MGRFYTLTRDGDAGEIYIYGDIGDFGPGDGMSAAALADQLSSMPLLRAIDVHINSYGGDAGEGLAIYNALRRHPARVTTTCDGMACSAASVVFMAGDERLMCEASVLMVHNAWSLGEGDAAELRKQADDLDTITDATKAAYLSRVSIDRDALSALMDAETWLTPEQAIDMGFATGYDARAAGRRATLSARRALLRRAPAAQEPENGPEEPENEPQEPENGPEEPENTPQGPENGPQEPENGPEDGPEEPEKGAENTDDGARRAAARFFHAIAAR